MVRIRKDPVWTLLSCGLACLLFVVAVLLLAQPASAGVIARDGKIHACYKAKGKGKGTLRIVKRAKARCPKRWKKVAWYAAGRPGPQGPQGEAGAAGATGETGPRGETGAPGRNENVAVNELEDKVTELLTKVQSLEAILAGVTNQQLKEAIAQVPVVESLCEQAGKLTEQSGELGEALGSFNTVLDTLLPLFSPVPLPTALPAYACPG